MAIKKLVGKLCAISLYHTERKSKNSFCQDRKRRPHFAKPRVPPWRDERNEFPLKTHWAAVLAARENFKKNEKSLIVEHIYNSARTYFIKNS